jgi:anti-sigma B factor antagonist
MADFEVKIDEVGGGEIHVINARGYIDTVTAPELEKHLQELMRKKAYKLVVNLKDVSYISSAGWGIFVSELRDIRENSGDLVLVEMSPDVYDVYELMEFSSILKSFDGLDDARSGISEWPPWIRPVSGIPEKGSRCSSGRACCGSRAGRGYQLADPGDHQGQSLL